MSDHDLTRLAQLILAGRKRRRADFDFCDRVEFALLREMAKRGPLSLKAANCTFRAVPAKQYGSPSQRRKWRANLPEGALMPWRAPRVLEIQYPERKSA